MRLQVVSGSHSSLDSCGGIQEISRSNQRSFTADFRSALTPPSRVHEAGSEKKKTYPLYMLPKRRWFPNLILAWPEKVYCITFVRRLPVIQLRCEYKYADTVYSQLGTGISWIISKLSFNVENMRFTYTIWFPRKKKLTDMKYFLRLVIFLFLDAYLIKHFCHARIWLGNAGYAWNYMACFVLTLHSLKWKVLWWSMTDIKMLYPDGPR